MLDLPDTAIHGPVVRSANPVIGVGIHDDETAQAAGFRGGTVPGSIHLDHFPPLLLNEFGARWFETGVVSMYFKQPTTHLEPVQVVHDTGSDLVDAWVVTPDGALVAEGAAGVAVHPADTPLRTRDRRPVEPAELDLLAAVPVGQQVSVGSVQVPLAQQHRLMADPNLWPDPLDWYRDESPWGPPVACPSVAVETLWRPFQDTLGAYTKPAVGMYGAIELHHRAGPILAGVDYELVGVVTDLSQSPKTEILWGETTALLDGVPVATVVMMIRLLR